MHVLIQQLLRLQELEIDLLNTKKQRESCEQTILSLNNLNAKARQELVSRDEALKLAENNYQSDELHLTELEEKLVQQKAKGLSVKKAEDYEALERSNEKLMQEISELQDNLITQLENLDVERSQIKQRMTEVAEQSKDWEHQLQDLQRHREVLITKEADQLESVKVFEMTLNGKFYQAYLDLRRCHKSMPIVVEVTSERKCLGCFLTLPNELISKIDDTQCPQFCEHCGRILYQKDKNE